MKKINFLKIIFCLVFIWIVNACSVFETSSKEPLNVSDDFMKEQTLEKLVVLVKEGKITATQLVENVIKQHRQHSDWNTYIAFYADSALEQARMLDDKIQKGQNVGKLAGIPFSIKDNILVAGMETKAGSKALSGYYPKTTATLVQKLMDEDAILIGRTNMHELAFGISGLNADFGYVKNPLNPDKIAGGSSSGAAVSVAEGSALFAIGTDTGGSVRIPAALVGLFGFRPTIERYDNDGLINLSKTRDTIGFITSSLSDLIYLDSIVSNAKKSQIKDIPINKYRIGVPIEYYQENLSPEVQRLFDLAVTKLENGGVTLIKENIKGVSQLNQSVSFPVVLYETREETDALLPRLGISPDVFVQNLGSPDVKGTFQAAIYGDQAIPKSVYQKAVGENRNQLIQTMELYFQINQLDAIIFPTTIIEATEIKDNEKGMILLNGEEVPAFPTYIQNTDPGSNSNMPGITIPIGKTKDGLAVGMELDGLTGADKQILELVKKIYAILNN